MTDTTSNPKMELSPEAREARNAYRRKYYREHKDRIIETNRRYWERKAAKMAQEAKEENARSSEEL